MLILISLSLFVESVVLFVSFSLVECSAERGANNLVILKGLGLSFV